MRFLSTKHGWSPGGLHRATRQYAWHPVWDHEEMCWVWCEPVWRVEDYVGGVLGVYYQVDTPLWLRDVTPEK